MYRVLCKQEEGPVYFNRAFLPGHPTSSIDSALYNHDNTRLV